MLICSGFVWFMVAVAFWIGSVRSGDTPSVSNSGTGGNVVLDFVLPKNPTRRITNQHILQSVKNRKRRIAGAENGVYLPDEWSCTTHLSAPSCSCAVAFASAHCCFFAAVVVLVEPLA